MTFTRTGFEHEKKRRKKGLFAGWQLQIMVYYDCVQIRRKKKRNNLEGNNIG